MLSPSLCVGLFATNPVLATFLQVSPSVAILAATAGLGLIALELNRPGLILPGAAGLTILLLAIASFLHRPLNPWAVLMLTVAGLALLANLCTRVPVWVLGMATVALVAGLRFLITSSAAATVNLAIALGCGTTIGIGGAWLSGIAFRARRAKAVN